MRKAGDVEVVRSGAPENAGVAHPAHAFVALRTVRRNRKEVAALPPETEFAHAVEQFAGALEADRRLSGKAVVDQPIDARRRRRAGVSGQLDVSETMERKHRRVGFLALAGKRV